ncbi:hypothetical protein HMPREF9162_0585 [Selenomonas sp. oral taxon 137 str. F0430]|uniref:hypothetical protein n=1 Tax=Selenomonas sp. oral taxon 137 TaxID=712531 RepID=UPI0001EB2262|nr:hypothetical protein [Selenomonas sp. oral taxon 137]EFR41429.1 hypothetical protein HMPREF9162_0585 [Selenomonas sp. oral taxon 137 str. F0430]
MYIVSEYIDRDKLPAERADELMTAHRAWFNAHFDRGDFLIVGVRTSTWRARAS